MGGGAVWKGAGGVYRHRQTLVATAACGPAGGNY
jgi:hypothetical protein